LSTVYDSRDSLDCIPIKVRVIDYKLKGENNPNVDNIYRTITNMLDYKSSPAKELAALYHERREIETLFNELKVSLKGSSTIIRSKVPDLVFQDIWGLIIIHFAIRQLMAQAAWELGKDPDKLSFIRAVHVIRRKLPHVAASPPSGEKEDD
jgi:IS4 transposase